MNHMAFILDPSRTGHSRAFQALYEHARRWMDTVDAMTADGVADGVAAVLADSGASYG